MVICSPTLRDILYPEAPEIMSSDTVTVWSSLSASISHAIRPIIIFALVEVLSIANPFSSTI